MAREHVGGVPDNLAIECTADFSPDPIELAALPMSAQGEAELTREQLEEAHNRLVLGGLLMASTDNPRDRWLHGELRTLFAAVSRREHPTGTVYSGARPVRWHGGGTSPASWPVATAAA